MRVTPVRTERISVNSMSMIELLDRHLPAVQEASVVAIASKVVSLCENRVAPAERSKEQLVRQESARYLPAAEPYGYRFTITRGTLIPTAGIDESNVGGGHLLWPQDPQRSANEVRAHLAARDGLEAIGVVITDSTCIPLRRGTAGISIAHSGFRAVRSYIGTSDLFGRPLRVSQANVAAGLAAAAVVTIGEGAEQTPICVIDEVAFIEFQPRDPDEEELRELFIEPEHDLFAPFLDAVPWEYGDEGSPRG